MIGFQKASFQNQHQLNILLQRTSLFIPLENHVLMRRRFAIISLAYTDAPVCWLHLLSRWPTVEEDWILKNKRKGYQTTKRTKINTSLYGDVCGICVGYCCWRVDTWRLTERGQGVKEFTVCGLWFTVDGVEIKEGREKSLPSFCLKSIDFYILLFWFFNYLEGDGVVAGDVYIAFSETARL